MKSKDTAIERLIEMAAKQQKQAYVLSNRSATALRNAESTKLALEEYVVQQEDMRRELTKTQIDSGTLRYAGNFAIRLSQAVQSQVETVAELKSAHSLNQASLMHADRSLQAFEKLAQIRQRDEMKRKELIEQRDCDELASRLMSQQLKIEPIGGVDG